MKKGLILTFAVLTFVSISLKSNAQVEKYKALYIYNICKLVEWPTNYGGDNFVIGIVGNNNALASQINSLLGSKSIAGKKITVVNVANSTDAKGVSVLYFTRGKEKLIADIGSGASNGLIISETSGATMKGSAINFYLQNSKLKFELKQDNITAKGLNVSGQLASLAGKTL